VNEKDLFRAFEYEREQLGDLAFEYTVLRGAIMISAHTNAFPCPVGHVWIRHVGDRALETLASYVEPWARRAGVRTALHAEMLRAYPGAVAVLTGRASGKASKRWLKKEGFKKTPTGWWLHVKRVDDTIGE
jgi:hypothetical protein